ncbi:MULTISPECIES: IS3 family transposase [Acinetobacter]|uniref:IS3 family transposase n=1 Tax=Acinetobacter TaxID=469 RepID=UPI0039173E52
MNTIVKRTQRDYSLAFKLSVVDQIEKGEMTYKQAQSRYGIQGRSTVLVWLRKHCKLDWSKGMPLPLGVQPMSNPLPLTPEQRIKELERQLVETQRKAEFFEAVIDVLKQDYGVSLVKKPRQTISQKKQELGFPISKCCSYLGISRQAYYKQCNRLRDQEQQDQLILRHIRLFRALHPRIGTRKLHYLLNYQANIQVGRDHLFDILREARLLIQPKRTYHKTTQSHHRFYCHPNLINQIKVIRAEQLWVADITYLPLHNGEAYLSLVTDVWSRKIVGYHVDDNLTSSSVVQAYQNALKDRRSQGNLIHHSDRGVQYCSQLYQAVHSKHGVNCSMTDGYDCYQNALAERVNGILKNEYLLHKPKDLQQAKKLVANSVKMYNQYRPHQSLKYKTPDEVHRALS